MRNALQTILMIIPLTLVLMVATKICLPFEQSFGCTHRETLSSDSMIHNKCEGFIVPFQNTGILLTQVTIIVEPTFWMCIVMNFDFHVDCQFTAVNPTTNTLTVTIAFLFSTHDIYGDHNEFETLDIIEGDSPISFSVALNFSLYSIQDDKLYFKGQLINDSVHPLLEAAYDMAAVAPTLYSENFEMFAFWDMTLGPAEIKDIKVNFAHYSGFSCCHQSKNLFVFDVTNARYWNGPVEFTGTFLKTLRYESILSSFNILETPAYFLLTGTDCSQKIEVVVSPITGEQVVATVGCGDFAEGTQVIVPIDIDMSGVNPPNEKLGSYTATLNWDPTLLSYVSYSGGTTLGWGSPTVNETNTSSGHLDFANANASGTAGAVNIINITFDVVGLLGQSGVIDLEFSAMTSAITFFNLMPLLSVQDCHYIITPAGILGDVNNDTFVNSTDALIVLSCDVGINVSQFCPMNCGDVNGDGLINSTDALIILSYDVGIPVPFPVGQSGCPQNVTLCLGCP